MPDETKVNKALSKEELALLGNIESMVAELKSMQTGDEDTEKAKKAEDEEKKKEEEAKEKEKEEKAKKEEMMKSIASEVLKMVKKDEGSTEGATVAPATPANDPVVLKQLADIAGVMKSISENQNAQGSAMEALLDGLGLTEAIEKAHKTESEKADIEKAQKENEKMVQLIASTVSAVNKSMGHAPVAPVEGANGEKIVNKGLADVNVLSALVAKSE
jgi:hypothetical protein